MKFRGRDVKFKRTVGAVSDLAKIAPNGDLDRLGDLFEGGNVSVTSEKGAQFLAILNKWYEKSLVFEEENYEPKPVPVEWFMTLDMEEYTELLHEAMQSFIKDDEPTVEAKDPGGKKNETVSK